MRIKYLIGIIMLLSVFASCKRESPTGADTVDKEVQVDVRKLVAPQGFNFSTQKQVKLQVSVVGKTFAQERFIIKLYRSQPNAGSLVSTGAVNAARGIYATTFSVPGNQDYIWIECVSSNGSSQIAQVAVKPAISHVFYASQTDGLVLRKSSSGLSCTDNCTNTYNNHTGSITIGKGEVACFTGTINSNISVRNGGAVKICATGTLTGLSLSGNARAYIIETANIVANSISTSGSSTELYLWSDYMDVAGTMSISGFVENHGILDVNGDFNVNSNADFNNYGTINVLNSLNVNQKFTNYGKVNVSGALNNNSKADFYNYCTLTVQGNISNNGALYNGRLIKCYQTYTQNSNSETKLDNVGYISTNNLSVNGTINGSGTSKAVVKVANTTTINSKGTFIGNVDLCDSNGVETNNGTITAPAAISCGGYIPTCPCNTEGFGKPYIEDDDGDGIANNQDEFPNDPLRAFNSYIPCFNVCYTIVFEDLWPATGDYDYNDMVLRFSVHKVLDANNKVKDLKFLVQPIAVGASFTNGFGFQLDNVPVASVDSVVGQSLIHNIVTLNSNGTEASQDDAVIVCFDSPEPLIHRAGGGMFNTQKDYPHGESDVQTVKVTFGTPVDDALLGIPQLNPFMFTNKRRGYEVHLLGGKPTNLVNTSLFGTENDRSVPAEGKYYHTANGLPWAFMLDGEFEYPLEKTPITDAYYFFDDWVLSGGRLYPNWYRNFPLYRNNDFIYRK